MKSSYLSLNPFITWMKEKHPVEWPKKFGRSAELEVEIGFGLGDFLIQQAKTYPEKNYLGIELGWVYVRRTLKKINLAGVKNIRVIQADIRVALERAFLEKGIVRSVVGEDSLVQDFWIEIVRKKKCGISGPLRGVVSSRQPEFRGRWTLYITQPADEMSVQSSHRLTSPP